MALIFLYRIYSNRDIRCEDQILRGVPLFKKLKDQYIIGAVDSTNDSAHDKNLDYEPMSPGH